MTDKINHPKHYNHIDGIECIQIVRHFNFNLGNVIKYVWRAGFKPGEEILDDLRKAQFYLADEIQRIETLLETPSKELP